jgi:type II secretory pathway component PulF
MITFRYRGKDVQGVPFTGLIKAESYYKVIEQLQKEGINYTDITKVDMGTNIPLVFSACTFFVCLMLLGVYIVQGITYGITPLIVVTVASFSACVWFTKQSEETNI